MAYTHYSVTHIRAARIRRGQCTVRPFCHSEDRYICCIAHGSVLTLQAYSIPRCSYARWMTLIWSDNFAWCHLRLLVGSRVQWTEWTIPAGPRCTRVTQQQLLSSRAAGKLLLTWLISVFRSAFVYFQLISSIHRLQPLSFISILHMQFAVFLMSF